MSDTTAEALQLGLGTCLSHLKGRPIRIATMCSDTESPLLLMRYRKASSLCALSLSLSLSLSTHDSHTVALTEYGHPPILLQ